jgi:hypothetical protein
MLAHAGQYAKCLRKQKKLGFMDGTMATKKTTTATAAAALAAARTRKLTPKRRQEIARGAAQARWAKRSTPPSSS